jgi:type IV pilus assembly protein PilA
MICRHFVDAVHVGYDYCLQNARNTRTFMVLFNTGEVVQMNRKGFTLIELLIVVVIIGILAAIAIPKFANTKEKAYLASMKSDLRNLVTAEEAYFADSVKYTSNLGTNYATTSGVVGPTITVTANGWTATVSHTTTTKTCAIYVGTTALAPANKEGEPKCA